MIGVITADIINSTDNNTWQKPIQNRLNNYGKSPEDWNIYRGDSFQVRITDVPNILKLAIILKSEILQLKGLDIRMAIGIGTEEIKTDMVTKNTGTAYTHSGRLLESLTSNLEIKTPWKESDAGLNAGLNLLNTIMEQWTPIMASYVNERLNHPDLSQQDIAQKLNSTQSNVSRVLARASWHAVTQYERYFQEYIKSMI